MSYLYTFVIRNPHGQRITRNQFGWSLVDAAERAMARQAIEEGAIKPWLKYTDAAGKARDAGFYIEAQVITALGQRSVVRRVISAERIDWSHGLRPRVPRYHKPMIERGRRLTK